MSDILVPHSTGKSRQKMTTVTSYHANKQKSLSGLVVGCFCVCWFVFFLSAKV